MGGMRDQAREVRADLDAEFIQQSVGLDRNILRIPVLEQLRNAVSRARMPGRRWRTTSCGLFGGNSTRLRVQLNENLIVSDNERQAFNN